MKHNNFTFWLTASLMLVCQSLLAHDFEVDGIYYHAYNDLYVAVTYQGDKYNSYGNEYSGNVVIPSSVTYNGTTYSVTNITEDAFYLCTGLTSIEIPSSVTSIGISAFYGCTGLTSVEIPNSVTNIGEWAFSGCTGLTSIEIPNSIKSIGSDIFYGCTRLTSIKIPSSVISIEKSAIYGCTSLTNIVIAFGNNVYDSRDNSNAIIETSTNTLIAGCKNTIIPKSVTSIGNKAFLDCTGLTSIEIPNCVASIGSEAFRGCTGLTSIEIPNSVRSIGSWAFAYCSSLTSLVIPNSVTSIGNYAFYDCSGLTSVTALSSTPASFEGRPFSNYPNATLYVPKGSKAAYEAAYYWNWFKEIIEIGTNTEELYNITIPEFAFGRVTSDKAKAAAGEVVTLTAVPNANYYLEELKVQKYTSGEQAQAPSIRTTNVSSAETVTMTYDATTGTYTGTYAMPACDITVVQADFVAKNAQTIVAQDVTCTMGETGLAITATNQTQGGGALSYAVSAGSDVVSVNATSGALTILKAGTATVTVTAAAMEKYLETTVNVNVTVLNNIIAQANDVSVPYDGAAHGIVVNVSAPTAGYTVTYGTEAGQYTLTTSPTQTVVGTKTVYYKVSANGYIDLEGSATITISKADIAAGNYDTPQSTAVTGEGLVYTGAAQTLVSGGTTNEGTTYYRVNGGAWSTAMPSTTEPGIYVIEWYVAGDANHNDMGSKTAPAGSLTVNILATKEVTIVNGLATFYNGISAYNFPRNAKAWTGTIDYANGCVNMVEVTGGIIPAGTAVVLTSDDEKVTLVQSLSEASAIVSDLKGTDTYTGGALTGAENIYVLYSGEFVWATSGTLASGKAYLIYDLDQAPTHAAAMRLWLNFDGASSIASLEASAEKSTYYDLQGTQVVAPRPNGLYIRNGKKVMVK